MKTTKHTPAQIFAIIKKRYHKDNTPESDELNNELSGIQNEFEKLQKINTELLAALERVVINFDIYSNENLALQIKSAISKAKGE